VRGSYATRSGKCSDNGKVGQADSKAEDMIWLLLWCGSGAIVGSVIGQHKGRTALGAILGASCGVFGWLMLLGADPRERAVRSQLDCGAVVDGAPSPDIGGAGALAPSPLVDAGWS
jgi:hypothetical protein